MQGYASNARLSTGILVLHQEVTDLVGSLPEAMDGVYGIAEDRVLRRGDPDPEDSPTTRPLRCHELARAVQSWAGRPAITVQDGWYGNVDHSWLWVPDPDDCGSKDVILDVYAVGRFPMVQLVLLDMATHHYRAGPGPSLYRESRPRTDIRDEVVVGVLKFWTQRWRERAGVTRTADLVCR